jgi:hypothetical protein
MSWWRRRPKELSLVKSSKAYEAHQAGIAPAELLDAQGKS